jgi:hypothetical protein
MAEGLRGHRALRWRDGLRLFDGAGGLQVFQLQLELLDLAEDLLALGSEEHALHLLASETNVTLDIDPTPVLRVPVI